MTKRKVDPAGFTGEMVARVGLTGASIEFRGWTFTIDNLMHRTSANDWTFGYMCLKPGAADRIAEQIREEMPWIKTVVLIGEVLPALEKPPVSTEVVYSPPKPDEVARRLSVVRSGP